MKNDIITSQNSEQPNDNSTVFFLNKELIAFTAAIINRRKEEFQALIDRASGGDLEAQYNLALSYYMGDDMKQDEKKAVYWFAQAAEQGHILAQYYLGYCYENGIGTQQSDEYSLHWYTEAAEEEFPPAQCAWRALKKSNLIVEIQ